MMVQLMQMIRELQKCEQAGATTACVMQIYVYIDTLAYLGMPPGQMKNTRSDFIDWVDRYLKTDPQQSYQYRGLDVYGARCATLHMFGADADFHQQYPTAIKFGYTDGGRHFYNPTVDPTLAIIGVASLISDFISALSAFIADLKLRIAIQVEKTILESRLSRIFAQFPFPAAVENPATPMI